MKDLTKLILLLIIASTIIILTDFYYKNYFVPVLILIAFLVFGIGLIIVGKNTIKNKLKQVNLFNQENYLALVSAGKKSNATFEQENILKLAIEYKKGLDEKLKQKIMRYLA